MITSSSEWEEDWSKMDYSSLVAEYLDFEIPEFVRRDRIHLDLPVPARNNIIYSIIGVRRCGKTFRMYQAMSDLVEQGTAREHIFHFTFDDDRIEPLSESTASDIFETYMQLVPSAREGCYLFFDEIQEAPGWQKFIRRVSEQHNVTIVLTGSSSKLLSRDIPTQLRGRSLSIEMWPLDFAEYCTFHKVPFASKNGAYPKREASSLELAFNEYLDRGGFPAVQFLGELDRSRMLQTYAAEILAKDVVERFQTTSLRIAERFARNALRSTGLKFSVNAQLKDLRSSNISISDKRLYALLDDLQDSCLLQKVSDYTLSIKENTKSSSKIYSVDSGLSLAVAPANHLDLGQRLETAVLIELKRRYGLDRNSSISSYSAPNCPEVDFIVGDVALEEQYALIQVTAELFGETEDKKAAKRAKREIGNLDAAMGNTGLEEGTIITLYEERDLEVEHGTVHVVPAWKWFLA